MSRRDLSPDPTLNDPVEPHVLNMITGLAEDTFLYSAAGRWYLVPASVRNFTTTTPPVGQVCYVPMIVTKTGGLVFDRIAIDVSTMVASSNVRLGLYSANGATGQPKTLLADYGTVVGTSVGVKELTVASTAPRGLSWFAVVNQGAAPTLRGSGGAHPLVGRSTNNINTSSTALITASGAVTAGYPTAAVASVGGSTAPVITIRAV